jgi:hypothetical protein
MSNLTTTWTSEEQAFLNAYQAECDRYVEEFKQQENPSDPVRTFWTNQIENERLNALDEKWKPIREGVDNREEGVRDLYIYGVVPITSSLETRLSEHYNTLVSSYQLPKAPEDIQHNRVIKVKCWKYAKRTNATQEYFDENVPFQSVLLVGQIIVQPSLWNGTKTWEFSEAYGTRILPIKLETSGSREIKKAYEQRAIGIATELSRLMDWEKADSLSSIGMRLLRDKIREIEGSN